MKKLKKILISILCFILIVVFAANFLVWFNALNKNFDSITELESREVGLVLGTSKYMRDGSSNPYYENRLDAAVLLLNTGKIKKLLISGDNRYKEYNEPIRMMEDLIKRGIDEDLIFLDYAGFRTLDSVIRSKEVFGTDHITIISQKFHNKRALLIAELNGIDAIAYNAEDPDPFKLLPVREFFARIKLFIDIIIGTDPTFLGEKESLER